MKGLKTLLQLFWVFLKIGTVTFGGGYAMLPILSRELVDKLHWTTDEELANYYAIGQCTPGVIAVNVSTFIGNKRKGFLGGLVATLGMVFVPTIIILIIAIFLNNFADEKIVKDALAGIRVCVCVLVVNAIIKLWKTAIIDIKTFLIFVFAFLLSLVSSFLPFSVSPAILVVSGGVAGIIIKQAGGKTK